jgi:hypothetical protein
MQAFGSSPTVMFLSPGRGAQASTPPVQDAFREVFQGRLLARLASRDNASGGTQRRSALVGTTRKGNTQLGLGKGRATVRSQPGQKEGAPAAASGSGESRQISSTRGRKLWDEARQTPKKSKSQTAALSPGADQSHASSQPVPNVNGSASASPPQALQDLIAFVQSQPDGILRIPPGQAPAVAAVLLNAGLPQEEVDRLLFTPGAQEKGLSAADLEAAWQRVQGLTTAQETAQRPGQPVEGSILPQAAQEIRQNPEYQTLWERLSLPQSMLPTLRLALARLGGTPEDLAQLEEETQGNGIPLARVWQVLQNVLGRPTLDQTSAQSQPSPGQNFSQEAILGERPVTGEEMAEWRQLLIKAGLQPELLQKLLGQESPATQEELKTTLLALAPQEELSPEQSVPKPLYLPNFLKMKPFSWQDQTQGDQPHLDGNGSGEQQQGMAAELAAYLPTATAGEGVGLPAFSAELQMLTQGPAVAGGPLSSTLPAWQLLSPEVRESLWTQLQSGIISNLNPGESQVSISLNPPELGQIQLTLRLSGQELAVTAVATRPEVAELATQGVQQLLQGLAQQGLVLTQFQVRLQEQPTSQAAPVLAGAREKGSESGGKFPSPSRRRNGEVDRFV